MLPVASIIMIVFLRSCWLCSVDHLFISDFLITDRPKVAFSAGLGYTGTYGPLNTEVVLIFSNVITNIGNAYSPNTGTSSPTSVLFCLVCFLYFIFYIFLKIFYIYFFLFAGVFRAPVKGIYHFTFTVFGISNSHYIGAKLLKNQQVYYQAHDLPKANHESVTRSISLVLEQSDEVYLKLNANYELYDDGNIYNSFDGFLLVPL